MVKSLSLGNIACVDADKPKRRLRNLAATMVCDAFMTSLRSTFAILTAGAAGMAALLAFLPAAGHDQLWCLYAAQHVMDGTRLYGPELLESNPPLILWLSMVPAALSHG